MCVLQPKNVYHGADKAGAKDSKETVTSDTPKRKSDEENEQESPHKKQATDAGAEAATDAP